MSFYYPFAIKYIGKQKKIMNDSIEGTNPAKDPQNQNKAQIPPDKEAFETASKSAKLSVFEKNLVDKWHFTPEQAKSFTKSMVNMMNSQIQKDLKKSREALKKMGEEYQ